MTPQVAFNLERARFARPIGFRCSVIVMALAAIAGCNSSPSGPEREAVSGTVTREGTPIDHGTILFKPTGGGPAASAEITDGKYRFNKENGPTAGAQKVEIVQFPRRGEGPPGTPKKELPILPETRFKGKMPEGGWVKDADVIAGVEDPLDFKIE